MTIFTDKVKQYNTRLKTELSLTDEQAAGIWGNLGGETGGFTALQEKTPTVAGSKGGFGWMQWTGVKPPNGRRYKYFEYCKRAGLDPASDEANYRYLVFETQTDEKHSLIQLRKTTTVDAATETFMLLNLRPGVQHLDVRKRWAAAAYNTMQNQNKVIQQTGAATGVVVGGGVIATQVDPSWLHNHIFAIAVGTAALIGGVMWIIHRHNEYKKQPVLAEEPLPTKRRKGKKNGKES